MKLLAIIIICIIICIILFLLLFSHDWDDGEPCKRIVASVVCIDRDADLAPKLYKSLKDNLHDSASNNILIICRETDKKTIQFWDSKAIVKTVPHYDISKRHNYDKIAEKRTIAMQYAKDHNFDALWFVDSDIIPLPNTLDKLCQSKKDICIAPYDVVWNSEPCVGIKNGNKYRQHNITWFDKLFDRRKCAIGGFGCTLIKKSAFDIKIEYKSLNVGKKSVYGEDIGFFINCNNANLTCEYLPNWIQPHLYNRVKN